MLMKGVCMTKTSNQKAFWGIVCSKNNNWLGFTLAEVLITLGIIGVVAAMTIPTLIAKHQEKSSVTQLLKTYTTLSEAFKMAVANEGSPETWNILELNSVEGAENIYNKISPYLKVTKNCKQDGEGCFINGYYKNLEGGNWVNLYNTTINPHKFVLSNGASVYIQTRSGNCSEVTGNTPALQNTCAFFGVDINGINPPNVMGEDLFWFLITKYGIIPRGTQDSTAGTFESNCSKSSGTSSWDWGCTGWVIYNKNMDYLHCDGLSWDGAHTCKDLKNN